MIRLRSTKGIINRYHEQVKERGHGRLTAQSNADESYNVIPDLMGRVEEAKLADSVAFFRRGNEFPLYQNKLDSNNNWVKQPQLKEWIERERTRPWTTNEKRDFGITQRKLYAEMGPVWQERLNAISMMAEQTHGWVQERD